MAKRKRMRWESSGTPAGEPREDKCTACDDPRPGWRCRVWTTTMLRRSTRTAIYGGVGPVQIWHWEARTFGRGALHVSGEARSQKLCRIVALAAVDAISKAGRATRR